MTIDTLIDQAQERVAWHNQELDQARLTLVALLNENERN